MGTHDAARSLSGRSPLSTTDREGRRRWIHPVVSKGAYYKARRIVAYSLIALFVALPHVRIAGRPAFLLDIPNRQLLLFGATFFATDTIVLPAFGIGLVLTIALVTALFGRIWCGWACPQPIYLEFVFRPIESLIEGAASVRNRLAHEPMTPGRWARRLAKWAVFLVVAIVLANTFVGYFVPTDRLWRMILSRPGDNWTAFVAVAVVTTMMFVDFTWVRELTCIIACPYGRLQSVLIDPQSMIVGYDRRRGEPRKKQIDRTDGDGAGDCVDCMACVRTCPTGIDIREGLQLECIGCTQCIDACDAIMTRVKKPPRLIRYTSLDELEGKPVKLLRPRVFLYGAIVLVAASALAWVLLARSTFEFEVTRQPGAPFYLQSDGQVVNRLHLRLTNRTSTEQRFNVAVLAPEGAALVTADMPIIVPAQDVVHLDALVRTPPSLFHGSFGRLSARIEAVGGASKPQAKDFVLLGPEGL